jgi:hypothetical protein
MATFSNDVRKETEPLPVFVIAAALVLSATVLGVRSIREMKLVKNKKSNE